MSFEGLERLRFVQEALQVELYGCTEEEAHAGKFCVRCKYDVGLHIHSEAGQREYEISGLCEDCFDEITKEPEEEPVNLNLDVLKSVTLEQMEEEYAKSQQKDHAGWARQWLKDNNLADNFEVIVADDFTIMLDYDQKVIPQQFFSCFEIFQQAIDTLMGEPVGIDYRISLSKSNNYHVTIHLPFPMDIIERIAWQACFGSDPKRDALHLLSIAKNEKNPILLIERKKPLALTQAPEPLQLTEGN